VDGRNFVEILCPARPENVGLLRLAAATFAAGLPFSLPEVEELKVAVSEAATNVVVHAYPGEAAGAGLIRVRLAVRDDGALVVEVHDDGVGIADLEAARRRRPSPEGEGTGLGFLFMESFADELEVTSAPGSGTTVRLVKRPDAPAEASEAR
jgi:stage II sporulation protein AB (anti-sigma F factor)